MRKLNEITAANQLNQKHDVFIDYLTNTINFLPKSKKVNDIGNKSWGKIDYLVNHCNYTIIQLLN